MNGPRPRGRAVALLTVALAVIMAAVALLQGFLATPVEARQLPSVAAASTGLAPVHRRWGTMPPWEVIPPGAFDPVVPTGLAIVRVPILMYHYIRLPPNPAWDRLGWNLSTSPTDFRQQMDYLAANGYHPVTLNDLRAYLAGRQALPDRPVVLTFDDGYADVYTEAFPVLKKHHFKAVAYIVSGFVGRTGVNVMPDQVREMDAYGIEIGAHTVDHVDLTKSGRNLAYEVGGSKAALEALVGHPVLDFCYPSGRYNAAVIQAVQAAGFESATTTQWGATHSLGDRYTWSRVRVSGGESLADFGKGLQQYERGVPPKAVTPIRIPRAYPLIYAPPVSELE